jgi:hypothetical protein
MTTTRMYEYNFKIKYHGVPIDVGRRHIHCPEHIASTHKIGAPFFKIRNVQAPRTINHPNNRKSTMIHFESETLGRHLHVFMKSKNENNSELLFCKHTPNMFGSEPILRLAFDVEGDSTSHDLKVKFVFWNTFLILIVPLFPVFVLINGLEDSAFFRNGAKYNPNPYFALYRLYVYMNTIDK